MARYGSTGWCFQSRDMPVSRPRQGFSLLEVMVAVLLSSLLISAITALLSGSVSAYRLQLSQGQLEESARFALGVLNSHIASAGYSPQPWREDREITALTDEAVEGGVIPGDQLGIQRWSMKNCYGNDNPVMGGDGQPEFYLLKIRIRVNANRNLTISCRYGPNAAQLTTQINNFGLVENVEAMQVLYATHGGDDGLPGGWMQAQAWQNEREIRAVRIALLLTSQQPVTEAAEQQLVLLDEYLTSPADGRLRRVSTLTATIRGRQR